VARARVDGVNGVVCVGDLIQLEERCNRLQ
jgi:hypothetical protein